MTAFADMLIQGFGSQEPALVLGSALEGAVGRPLR